MLTRFPISRLLLVGIQENTQEQPFHPDVSLLSVYLDVLYLSFQKEIESHSRPHVGFSEDPASQEGGGQKLEWVSV